MDEYIKKEDAIEAVTSLFRVSALFSGMNDNEKEWREKAEKVLSKYEVVTDTADIPQGEWISKHNGYWTCSECGLSFLFYAKGNFCPNCGADMRKESE